MRLRLIYFLASIWLISYSAPAATFYNFLPQTNATDAKDLKLSAEEEAKSQALSNFAWGFFLQLQNNTVYQEEVVQQYLKALKLNPKARVVLDFLLTPWVVEGKYAKIVENLRPIAESHPEIPQLQLAVAEALAAQNKQQEAVAFLQNALRKNNWSSHILFRELFINYWRMKQHENMKTLLAKVRSKPEMKDSFVVHQANALFFDAMSDKEMAENDKNKAAKLKDKALEHARNASINAADALSITDIQLLAEIFSSEQKWGDLVNLIQAAQQQESFLSPELNLLLVEGLQKTERKVEALAILQDVVRMAQLHPRLYVNIGRHYFDAGKLNEAAVFYERALNAFPRAVHIYFQLAFIYVQLDEGARAAELLSRVNNLPAEGHFLLAHAYQSQGQNEEAVQALLQAENIAIENENKDFFTVDFYVFLATLLEEIGETDRSLETVRKGLELDATNAVCANFLGYVLADHDRELEEAEKWVKLALKADPDNFAYLDSLAWVYYKQQRFNLALDLINRTLRLAHQQLDPVILDHAGDIYAANELWTLAQQYWLQAAAAEPSRSEELQKKIDKIPIDMRKIDPRTFTQDLPGSD